MATLEHGLATPRQASQNSKVSSKVRTPATRGTLVTQMIGSAIGALIAVGLVSWLAGIVIDRIVETAKVPIGLAIELNAGGAAATPEGEPQ